MRRLFLPLATLILLVAAFLRLWQLSDFPPGPHYDEAVYLIITRSIAFGGARFFPIVEAYQGREVLYMYLNAPLLHLLGNDIFTLHLSNAFFNLITVAASIGMGRAIFRGRRGLIIGLTIGVLIALSFPQIWLGRQAFRAVSQPLMQALALWCLWRGLRGRWTWLALGGFFAGAALYTYMASRLFPLWVVVGGLALLLSNRSTWRLRLRQGALFFGVLVVVALPMGIYAVQRPDVFFNRLAEVTQTGEPVTLAESIVLHLKMFFIEGDPYLRYNIPGRPYLTWPEGLLLLVGIGVAARRLFAGRRLDAPERAAYALALLSPLMVIPSLISVGGLPPSHMRSLGMIPLIFVLVAVGFEAVFERFIRILRLPALRLFMLLVIGTLLVGGLLVGKTYFEWAGRADVYYETDADLDTAAKWLIAQQQSGALDNTFVYVAAKDRQHPTMTIQPIPPVIWLGTDTLMRAPEGSDGLYIFPRSVPPPADWREWLEPGRVTDLPLGPDRRTAFEAFRLPGDKPLPPSGNLSAGTTRNSYLTLVGLQTASAEAGGEGSIVMDWRIDAPLPMTDFTPILTLEDENGTQLYRVHQVITGTDEWHVGEVLLDRLTVQVPTGTPPGEYRLRVAWVTRSSNEYASYLNDDGTQAGVWAEIGRLTVTRPQQFPDASALLISHQQTIDVLPGVRLLGWDDIPASVRPGERFPVTLYWQSTPTTDERVPPSLRLILRNPEGQVITLWTGTAAQGRHPASEWIDGELVTDHVYATIDRTQESGSYSVLLDTGTELVPLGIVEIHGVARLFDPPTVQHEVNAQFGDSIWLRGYTLETGEDQMRLELVWYAEASVNEDYKVFVHVVNEAGEIIEQHDAMPRENTYPTSLWAAGEYVTDLYLLPAVDGVSLFRVGLYLPQTGERLQVQTGTGGDFLQITPP